MVKVVSLKIKKNWKKMYESGLTLREIGEISGCSYASVSRYLKSIGIELKNRTYIEPSIKEPWKSLCEKGLTTTEIGLKYGCSSY